MTIVRLTLICAIVLNLGIASASASYQQPQRPSRSEIERIRTTEEQKRLANIQVRLDAIEAATRYFEMFHTEGCGQPGDWSRKGIRPSYREQASSYNTPVTYKPKYWITQFRGVAAIQPNYRGILEPDAVTRANYPDVEYIAQFSINAEAQRSYLCQEVSRGDGGDLDYNNCRWTPWAKAYQVMEFTLWRRGGDWQLKDKINFHYDTPYGGGKGPSEDQPSTLQFSKPDCREVQSGLSDEAQSELSAAAERSRRIAAQQQAAVDANSQEAERTFSIEAPRLIESFFSSCRALASSNACFYRVTNYTWTVGRSRVGDDLKPWLRGRVDVTPNIMQFERPVTINLHNYKGNCNGWIEPKSSFQLTLRYSFYKKKWEIFGSHNDIYYTRPENKQDIDFRALEIAEAAPKLCR